MAIDPNDKAGTFAAPPPAPKLPVVPAQPLPVDPNDKAGTFAAPLTGKPPGQATTPQPGMVPGQPAPVDPNDKAGTFRAPTPTPAAPPAATYGENDIQGRVRDIASQDSALNQMARTEAAKVMNSRGMLNSSMYAGAAEDAVLRQAVPIASQEAAQAFQGAESARQRASTEGMQAASLTAAEQSQIRDIKSREGQAAADRLQQQIIQQKDIANQQTLQQKDIGFRTGQGALDRATQEKLASWNLKSSDRNSAGQLLTNMETMYQSAYQTIMSNPNLDAMQRTAQLTAAKTMRDKQLNFVEQLYNVDLVW